MATPYNPTEAPASQDEALRLPAQIAANPATPAALQPENALTETGGRFQRLLERRSVVAEQRAATARQAINRKTDQLRVRITTQTDRCKVRWVNMFDYGYGFE